MPRLYACANRRLGGIEVDVERQARRFAQSKTWVGICEERIAGFTNLTSDGLLDCLYVHSRYQRRGLATAMVAALEHEALSSGLNRLHSEVSITARPFFESRGFLVMAAQRVRHDGETYDNFRMEKALRR